MEKRKSGFYWVIIKCGDTWQTALYSIKHGGWLLHGVPKVYTDDFIFEINPNRIMSPDEWE